MDRNLIRQALIETVGEVQEMSGCTPIAVDAQTRPIYDLDGFDSLRGAETTVLLAKKLKCEFKAGKGEVNVFVSKDGRKALSVEEAVSRLIELSK
jgi:hypothetical protein